MAKIRSISSAYLSLLINGERKRRGDIKERYEALRDAIRNHHSWKRSVSNDLAIIETLAKTGMRRAELANLKVGDIDLQEGQSLKFRC